jgi:modulator of FtsH protease HflC
MKNPLTAFAGLVILILAIVVLAGSVFTVQQTEQALVLRFGEATPGRSLVTDPGLHFKFPLIETVVYIDNRILDLETSKQEVLASDNNRIEVDAFLRYKIVDPLRFYQTVGSSQGADGALSNVLNSAVRRVLGEANISQIVRDQRAELMVKIRNQVESEGTKFGVTIVDVRIRRADLPRQISEKVFSRMQTERQREAAEFRAQGSEQAQKITAKADRDAVVLRAQAQQEGDTLRGQGEAERNTIFAAAYSKDPQFFAFWRSMQAYETGLRSSDTRMIMSPNSNFFRFFGNPTGAAPTEGSAASTR